MKTYGSNNSGNNGTSKAGGFRAWMAKVDAAVAAKTGLSALDLPDCPYYSWYEDGVTPKSAAAKAIKAARE